MDVGSQWFLANFGQGGPQERCHSDPFVQEEALVVLSLGERQHVSNELPGLLRVLAAEMGEGHEQPYLQGATSAPSLLRGDSYAFQHAERLFDLAPGDQQASSE